MARIINRSQHPVEVFGTVGGTAKRWILPARDEEQNLTLATDGTFNCTAVREANSVGIFEASGWWRVLTGEAYVYDYPDDSTLSLHCLPFLHPKGYEEYDESNVTIPLDPQLSLATPAAASLDSDGELNSSHLLFGKFVRTGNSISVRIDAHRSPFVDKAAFDAQLDNWKQRIETVWNNAATASSGNKLTFECDWVESASHYRIVVFASAFFRAFMFKWAMDMDNDKAGNPNVFPVSAHEFGHFLGLTDGYVRDGEIPWLKRLFADMADDPEGDVGKVRKKLEGLPPFTSPFAAPLFSNKERAIDRGKLGRKLPSTEPSDMMTSTRLVGSSGHIPNTHIPTRIIDVVDAVRNERDGEHKTQDLYWKPTYF